MVGLWERENRKGLALYSDLFEGVSKEYQEKFDEWNQRLDSPYWKHTFLGVQNDPVKSPKVAFLFDSQGNHFFQRNEFHKAMEFYNQAICFAQFNSAQMRILYAKRGFCFFHLAMYKECMTDMELALVSEIPSGWKSKVNECQANCAQFMSTSPQRPPITPTLSFDADDTFPCIANVLEIIENDGLVSSDIVAKTDIDLGQVVLVEKAFTSIAVGHDTAFCLTCLKMCTNLTPCSGCTDAMFCSMECRQQNEVHNDYLCGEACNRMPSYIKFVVQSILEAFTAFATVDDLMKFVKAIISRKEIEMATNAQIQNYGLFLGLKSSTKPLPLQLIYEVYTTLMAMPLIQNSFYTKSKERFLMHLVGQHVQILLCNSYGGFEPDQDQFILASMTNVASLFQHSCIPNLFHITIGNQTIFVTNQPVKKGDRLCIDYCPEEYQLEERMEMLQKDYGIICSCAKCKPHHPIIDSELRNDPSFLFIRSYKKYIGSGVSKLLKIKCAEFLQKYKHQPWTKEKGIVISIYTQCLLAELNIA